MNDLKETKQIQKETHETVIQISHNLKYIKTYDYDLFSFYTANRVPTHWKKILQSIELQDLTDRQPILVYECKNTGQFFISDGQNRFLACKNSKRPIYAIVVTGSTLKQGESSLSILNSYQKNWTKSDYLEYFCTKGYTNIIGAMASTVAAILSDLIKPGVIIINSCPYNSLCVLVVSPSCNIYSAEVPL